MEVGGSICPNMVIGLLWATASWESEERRGEEDRLSREASINIHRPNQSILQNLLDGF